MRIAAALCFGSLPPQVIRTANVSLACQIRGPLAGTYAPTSVTGMPSISSSRRTISSCVSHRQSAIPPLSLREQVSRSSFFALDHPHLHSCPFPFHSATIMAQCAEKDDTALFILIINL